VLKVLRQTERRLAGAALKGRPRSPLFQDERKAHATLVRRPQGAERQLMEEDQTKKRRDDEASDWSQSDPGCVKTLRLA
jgi:hypothetical protein